MRATMRNISTVAGVAALMLGMTGNAGAATSALTFSSCGGGATSCAAFSRFVGAGEFSDEYTFSLTDLASTLGVASLSLDFKTLNGIDDFSMGLWSGSPDFPMSNLELENDDRFIKYDDLASGDYFFRLTGNADSYGGYYGGFAAVTPVPEASTWVMMLVGLGLVGLALRRKTESAELIAV